VEVFARVQAWLDRSPAGPGDAAREQTNATAGGGREPERQPRPATVSVSATAELTIAGVQIRETPLRVEQPFGELFGVLAEPMERSHDGLCAVILNAGATRRIGPNRMWVEVARRWAARGVATLRLDVEGIGDADGDGSRLTELAELYVPALVDQTLAALDELERQGVAHRFLCVGLCSGAYWSFHAALRDERVAAALMLNPQALSWSASLEPIRTLRKAFLQSSSWHRLLHGEASLAHVGTVATQAPRALVGSARRGLKRRRARRDGDELDHAFDRLESMDKYLLFAFSGEEPLHYELQHEGRLERLQRSPNVELSRVPGHDHTLRPSAAQRGAHEALDRALDRVLGRERHRSPACVS
jgi:dienelactone hydrolase